MLVVLALTAQAATLEAPDAYMPHRDFDLQHLHLALEVDVEGRSIQGTATHRVAAIGAPADFLRLDAVALDISEVRVDGTAVEGWRIGHESIDIPMPGDLDTHEVAIDYAATPELGLHFRVPGKDSPDAYTEVWSQGQDDDNRYWLPSWDYPNDRFSYTADITAADGLVVATNGALTGSAPARSGFTTWSFALEEGLPTYLIALVVGDYAVYTETLGELTFEYLVGPGVPEQEARVAGGLAVPQTEYFNQLLGTDYAWPIYRQAFVQRFMYGGMENTSLTINTDSVLGLDEFSKERAEGLVAHELAHQWFGDLLTCYGWRDRWLNEGFATMYASRWTEQAHGRAYYDEEVFRRMDSASRYTTPMARRGWSPEGPDSTGVYDRGMMVLHMLRTHLGDAVYDAGIRDYVGRHAHDFVESADLRRALENASGEHLGWLFDGWVHGTGVPEISTRWGWQDGRLEVVLAQGEDAWHAPVEVEIGLDDDTITRKVWLGAGETRLVVDLDDSPAYVAVDPRGGVLARWNHTQAASHWTAQASAASTPYARMVAFEHLGKEPASAESIEVLAAALAEDIHPRFRIQALRALEALGTDEAGAALSRALEDEDERLRARAVEALGSMPSDPARLRAIRSAQKDSAASVRGQALRSLAAVDEDAGLKAARLALVRPDGTRRTYLHTAAVDIIGEHGEASDLRLLSTAVRNLENPRLMWSISGALRSRIQALDEDRRDAARSSISRVLEGLLEDDDFRVRQSAVRALGSVGDPEARKTLLALASDTSVSRLAEGAREAARAILNRSDDRTEEQVAEDAEALSERLDTLEKRIKDLETWR